MASTTIASPAMIVDANKNAVQLLLVDDNSRASNDQVEAKSAGAGAFLMKSCAATTQLVEKDRRENGLFV